MKSLEIILMAILLMPSNVWTQVRRPNLLLILTDDLESASIDSMPNLQSLLVEQGVSFSNFFVNVSVCCPSRASILRGQFAHNHQIYTNKYPEGGFEKFRELGHENSTIATWLQTAGYKTALIGKYLNGYPAGNKTYVPRGWDEWAAIIDGHYYNFQLNENGRVVSYDSSAANYETDVLARKTLAFIRAAGETPFFVYLAPYAPHSPATFAERHQKEFKNAMAPRTPSFNEADLSDKPRWLSSRSPIDSADVDRRFRKRLRAMLAVDEMVKQLVDSLATMNKLDNTYLFFTSDNGFHLGEHRLVKGKNTAYEEAIRVPLIVRGPQVPAGRAIPHISANIDLAPTFAELAGASTPGFVDGVSLAPLLGSNPPAEKSWRSAFIIEHYGDDGDDDPDSIKIAIPEYQALRTERYKYVEYITGERELYDLRDDPYELENFAGRADSTLLATLAMLLDKLRRCAGANCLITAVREAEHDGRVPRFELLQNFPNPFNPSTVIGFQLSVRSHVTLKVFDVTGREVATLVDGEMSAGKHAVTFAPRDLAGGIYFYQLTAGKFTQTRKAIFMQ